MRPDMDDGSCEGLRDVYAAESTERLPWACILAGLFLLGMALML